MGSEMCIRDSQQSAVLFGEFPQTLKEAGFRLNEAGVADDRLEDHARDGVGVLGEQGLNGFEVVVRRREGVGCGAARDTGGSGRPSVATPEPAFTRNMSAWPW